jgi:hypothetical protein
MNIHSLICAVTIVGAVLPRHLIAAQVIASAHQGAVQRSHEKRVSTDLRNVPLRQAVDEIATQSGTEIAYAPATLASAPRVTLVVTNLSARESLERVLKGTAFKAVLYGGQLAIVATSANAEQKRTPGVITGKVTQAKTGKGIPGVNVSVNSDTRGVTSREDGSYRLVGVAAGTHTVTARLIGYAKQTRSVTVGEGATVTVDFKLELTSNVLDQIVVTGTVVATELKAVPNAITIITAKQLEERGITRIDQLFRGDVPAVFAQKLGESESTTPGKVYMSSRGGTTLNNGLGSALRTFVDGVELADPSYIGLIDPKSIERIEILTGPQASTIYGSNAISGVMQIFTKRGTTPRPQLTLSLQTALVENNFSQTFTPSHDHSANLSGREGRISYSAGGSGLYV